MQPLQLTHRRYHTGTRRDLQFKEGPSHTQAGLHGPYTTPVRLSVRPCPSHVAPGQAGGAVSGGSGGCELKRHTCGGGGEDTGQEAPRLYTSICMPNPLPGSGASGPPSAPQLTSLAGWFPSRHRAEVGVEQRGEKGGCSHPHAPSHTGRLGGSCPLPELVGSAQGAERGVGGGGGLFLRVPGMFLCSRLPPGQCEGHRAPPRPSWMLPTL